MRTDEPGVVSTGENGVRHAAGGDMRHMATMPRRRVSTLQRRHQALISSSTSLKGSCGGVSRAPDGLGGAACPVSSMCTAMTPVIWDATEE